MKANSDSSMMVEIDKLESKDPKVKYGYAKKLLGTAKAAPQNLYDQFDHWVKMLHSSNNILKWTAIDILGYLSPVDKENKTDKIINELFKLLHSGELIACNHAIFALGLIAQSKPEKQDRIIKELLKISKDSFETEECREIATGKAILALGGLSEARNNKSAVEFIKKARTSKRNATRKKAEAALKKIATWIKRTNT